jgi:hypothetical protein
MAKHKYKHNRLKRHQYQWASEVMMGNKSEFTSSPKPVQRMVCPIQLTGQRFFEYHMPLDMNDKDWELVFREMNIRKELEDMRQDFDKAEEEKAAQQEVGEVELAQRANDGTAADVEQRIAARVRISSDQLDYRKG